MWLSIGIKIICLFKQSGLHAQNKLTILDSNSQHDWGFGGGGVVYDNLMSIRISLW